MGSSREGEEDSPPADQCPGDIDDRHEGTSAVDPDTVTVIHTHEGAVLGVEEYGGFWQVYVVSVGDEFHVGPLTGEWERC